MFERIVSAVLCSADLEASREFYEQKVGLTLSPETVAALGRTEGRKNRWRTIALWIIAITFIAILFAVRRLAI